ncbi:MAG: pilus assembly protein [Caldilineales bacterium]|nr:pilus assembly protein [Caldilineales bacterium]
MSLHHLRRENGQSFAELAIILPLLVLLTLGVLDLGRGVSAYIMLTNGAREGARWLSIHPTDTNGARQRAMAEIERLGADNTNTTITASSGGSGQLATVTIDHALPFLSGLLGSSAINIRAAVSMPIF